MVGAGLRGRQAHRLQGPAERIEDQTENLERDDSEQRLIAGLAKDDWRVRLTLWHGQTALGSLATE